MTALTPDEAMKWLKGTLAEFPERLDYSGILSSMRWMTTNIARDEREAFVGALRTWLREEREPWLAIDLAAHHHLTELRSDIEAVRSRMERGDGYPACYRGFVPRIQESLDSL